MIIALILAICVGVFFLFITVKVPSKKMYAFQVYDNLGKPVYTKRVDARNEIEAGEKIKKYIPKDYTYSIIWNEQ